MEELAVSQDFLPDDIIISVMGLTGSGKSTFIARCTGIDDAIGHGLESFTREVSYATIKHRGHTIRLIDTPGFDDSDPDRDDLDIFKDISYWLLRAYAQNPPLLLSGIIYLYPITNVRLLWTDNSNLAMFKALCGKECLPSVVMATTMWGETASETKEERHTALSEQYWNDMGTTIRKHADTKESALSIIDHIIKQNRRITLKIQRELASGKQLQETDAGRELSQALDKDRKAAAEGLEESRRDLEEAQERRDEEDMKDIQQMQIEYQKEIQAKELAMERMKVDLEAIFLQKEEQLRKDQELMEAKGKADSERVLELTQQLSAMSARQQEAASTPVKYEKMDLSDASYQIQAQIQQHKLEMELLRERHAQDMEDMKRYNEMLKVAKDSAGWGKGGAIAGAGSLVFGAGSFVLAAAACCVM